MNKEIEKQKREEKVIDVYSRERAVVWEEPSPIINGTCCFTPTMIEKCP
jgi:hypothetical protein